MVSSTFNHECPETEVDYDTYQDFCRSHGLNTHSPEAVLLLLLKLKHYPESVVRHAHVVERVRDTDGGVMTVLGHDPMFKLRVLFVLDRPYT